MPTVSILPCLDLMNGRVVKGVGFVQLKDAGDPVAVAQAYAADGATELAMLDITATVENRKTALAVLEEVARSVAGLTITFGGGITSIDDAQAVLDAGATRVSISSAAIRNPRLIADLAESFGSERVVVALDVDQSPTTPSGYEVFIDGGRTATGIDVIDVAKDAQNKGAGLLLPTSKTVDGAKAGYDTHLIQLLKESVTLPIVASGGAGTLDHFLEAARAGADFLLAASVFHFGEIRVSELAQYLTAHGIQVR